MMNSSNAPVRRFKINERRKKNVRITNNRQPVSLPIYFQIEVCHDIHIQLDNLSTHVLQNTENDTEIVALTVNNLLQSVETHTI